MSARRPASLPLACGLAAAAVVAAGGIAVASVNREGDPRALPPHICDEPAGSTAGGLPDTRRLDQLAGRPGSSAGSVAASPPAGGSAVQPGPLGAGSPQDLRLRGRALAGSVPAGGVGSGRGSAGSGQPGTAGVGAGGFSFQPGGTGQGAGQGTGQGAGTGQGQGAAQKQGQGAGAGQQQGPANGVGQQGSQPPAAGSGQGTESLPPKPVPAVEQPKDNPRTQARKLDDTRHSSPVAAALILLAGLALLAAAVWLAVRLRRTKEDVAAVLPDVTPQEAAARVERAEREQDHDAALRWGFVFGLLRLDAAGRLDYDPSTPTRRYARRLRSAVFGDVARTFDEVVYGGRPAMAQDVTRQREGFDRLLASAAEVAGAPGPTAGAPPVGAAR